MKEERDGGPEPGRAQAQPADNAQKKENTRRRRKIKLVFSGEEQRLIDSRVQDIEKAATRSRWIYGFALLASLMLFSVAYNEYFSWMRAFAIGLPAEADMSHWQDRLQLLLMREWVSSLQFDLPYIGGKFGASDAGPVGGVVLFFVSIWCLYSAKRENYLIYFLAKDVHGFGFSDEAKFYLTTQIASTQLFIVSGKRSKIYGPKDIENRKPDKDEASASKHKNFYERATGFFGAFYILIKRGVVFSVFMAPALSLLFVFAVDMLTLREVSPFRMYAAFENAEHESLRMRNNAQISISDKPLYLQICKKEKADVKSKNYFLFLFIECENTNFRLRIMFALAMALLVFGVMLQAHRYQVKTVAIVLSTDEWKKPLLKRQLQSLGDKAKVGLKARKQ
jgi:hypothetical protein